MGLTTSEHPWYRRLWPFGKSKGQNKRRREATDDILRAARFFKRSGVPYTLRDLESVVGRERYGPIVIKGYLSLIALQIICPLALFFIVTWGQPSSFISGLRDVKDFIIALSASLSGVSGLAGYVVGHYFRESR